MLASISYSIQLGSALFAATKLAARVCSIKRASRRPVASSRSIARGGSKTRHVPALSLQFFWQLRDSFGLIEGSANDYESIVASISPITLSAAAKPIVLFRLTPPSVLLAAKVALEELPARVAASQ